MVLPQINCCALGSNGLTSLAYPSNDRGRGLAQVRPKPDLKVPQVIELTLCCNAYRVDTGASTW